MTNDEVDAAIRAVLVLPATNAFPIEDDERDIYRAGYRDGIEAAAKKLFGIIAALRDLAD